MPKSFWLSVACASLFVFALAIVLRVPSCHQSLWLDELHSSWAVADGFGEVADRAAMGNQTPYYFQLLWVWEGIVGDSELALRLSSVVLTSLAAGLLTLGVAMQTERLTAGLIAGGIVAIESNAVFFGTELRPYAAVVFCAVPATWAAVASLDPNGQRGRWRFAMILCVCLAALLHPTSLGVLGTLVALTLGLAQWRKPLSVCRWDAFSIVVVLLTIGLLYQSSLPDSWSRRDQWRAFGVATDHSQLWSIWCWIPIVFAPAGVGMLGLIFHLVGRRKSGDAVAGWVPLFAGVLGTVLFFYASYFDWVPLWHRRYFVSSLPLLAWSAGTLATSPWTSGWIGRVIGCLGMLGCLSFLLWYQGSWDELKKGRIPVQWRGEPWREVVAMVRENRQPGDQVWVDTGLIEASFFQNPMDQEDPPSERQWRYLTFPLRGAYRVGECNACSVMEHSSWSQSRISRLSSATNRIWLICRYRSDDWIRRFAAQLPGQVSVVSHRRMSALSVSKLIVD